MDIKLIYEPPMLVVTQYNEDELYWRQEGISGEGVELPDHEW